MAVGKRSRIALLVHKGFHNVEQQSRLYIKS